MNPITRKETFLAAAGGQSVSTPKPITREEMFLQRIAENGGCPGGGGSSAEWAKLHEETLAENVKYIELDIPDNATEIYCSGIVKASTELSGKPILLSAWASGGVYQAGDNGLKMTVHVNTEQSFVAHFIRVMDKVTGECHWGPYAQGSSHSYWGKLHNVATNKFYFTSNYGAGIIPVESNISVYWR